MTVYEPLTTTYRLRRADGSHAVVESTMRPRHGEDGNLVDLHVMTRDVSDRQAADELRRRFEAAFSDAPIGMALVDLDGRFMRVNRSLCEITGYQEANLLELNFQEITHPADLDADLAHLEQLRNGEIDRYSMEKRYRTAGHNQIWVNLSVSMVRDGAGEPLHYVSQIEDITDRKRLEEQLHWLADHDSLTRLWNRRRFDEELRRQVSRCQRYAERAALLLIDLDDFKPVNDHHGHKVGDDLLIEISAALKTRLRDTDSIARIGGDEFAALVTNVSPDQAETLAEAITEVIGETQVEAEGQAVSVGASVGVALIDEDPAHQLDVFVRADKAMYRAKGSKAGSDLARS
jgi:diguanylate cyclase (GGDEF)-like protein/PAS domain S-box-containing protein